MLAHCRQDHSPLAPASRAQHKALRADACTTARLLLGRMSPCMQLALRSAAAAHCVACRGPVCSIYRVGTMSSIFRMSRTASVARLTADAVTSSGCTTCSVGRGVQQGSTASATKVAASSGSAGGPAQHRQEWQHAGSTRRQGLHKQRRQQQQFRPHLLRHHVADGALAHVDACGRRWESGFAAPAAQRGASSSAAAGTQQAAKVLQPGGMLALRCVCA